MVKHDNTHQFNKFCRSLPKVRFENACNKHLETMVSELTNLCEHPLTGDLPHDPTVCYRSLIVHRCRSKYSRRGDNNSRLTALKNYVTFESTHVNDYVNKRLLDNLPKGHGLNKTRHYLSQHLADFDIWSCLREANLRFSPGKTLLSTVDETSIVAKLSCRDHWTVTPNCLEYAVFMIYHHRGLKLAAKAFFPKLSGLHRKQLYLRFKNGFKVFRYLLLQHVLTVTEGALGTTVPKNERTDRFINIESGLNVLVQACIEGYIRKKLRFLGNDLNIQTSLYSSTQHLHGSLIKHKELCTVDLKNASDSTILYSIEKLFPRHFVDALINSRSYVVSIPELEEEVYPLKLSSMGNGYTFGLMSFFLHSIGASNGIPLNVFGDDIILKSCDYSTYRDLIELVGYQINEDKSFINHPFRESCGYFYHQELGYLLSFDITRIDSNIDLIVTTNKLTLLIQECETHGFYDIRKILLRARDGLLSHVPALQKGPLPCSHALRLENLSLYCYDSNYLQKSKRSAVSREIFSKISEMMKHVGDDLYHDASVVLVPRFRSKISIHKPNKSVRNLLLISGNFSNKRRGIGQFYYDPCVVSQHGAVFRLAHIFRLQLDDELLDFDVKSNKFVRL